jgi:hypothetical protein
MALIAQTEAFLAQDVTVPASTALDLLVSNPNDVQVLDVRLYKDAVFYLSVIGQNALNALGLVFTFQRSPNGIDDWTDVPDREVLQNGTDRAIGEDAAPAADIAGTSFLRLARVENLDANGDCIINAGLDLAPSTG